MAALVRMELRSGKTASPYEERNGAPEDDHWSSVAADILLLIAGKIVSLDDYVRFCAVCRSWYLLATDFNYNLNLGPLAMTQNNLDLSGFRFENLAPDPTFSFENLPSDTAFSIDLPEIAGRRLWGSRFGWVITDDEHRLSLLNPFTGVNILVPPFPDHWIPLSKWIPRTNKAFLTTNPDTDPDNFILIVVGIRWCRTTTTLAFVRPGGHIKSWSSIRKYLGLHDFGISKGNLYGVEIASNVGPRLYLFRFNDAGTRICARVVRVLTLDLTADQRSDLAYHGSKVLIDVKGELCLCVLLPSKTLFMKTFKIDLSTGKLSQFFMADHFLFLSDCGALFCKATYPHNKISKKFKRSVQYAISNYTLENPPILWILPSIKFSKLEDLDRSEVKHQIRN